MSKIYRVEVDYYSVDYDDRMCSTSTPFMKKEDAEKAYKEACSEYCIDNPSMPARVTLVKTVWKDSHSYGVTSPIKRNWF